MSRPRYDWWPYVKGMIRRYPALRAQYADLHSPGVTAGYSGLPPARGASRATEELAARELPSTAQREYEAVRRAVEQTARYPNGRDRLAVIRLVLWERSHTLEGAAQRIPCSTRHAKEWHGDFIRQVACNFGLMDE